jgi:RNA recognition motif-containing protein
MKQLRDDTATLRVTNLSEDTSEMDLAELFRPFGHTQRIYLAKVIHIYPLICLLHSLMVIVHA